jgi:hypothetical protein
MGPYPADSDGNTAIIVIIDTFSRFVELYPAKDGTAKEAAKALLTHVGRYGAPYQLLSDNGSQYVNETITELVQLIGIEHNTILAYSHEENAIVERANKEVLRHIRAMIFEENIMSEWWKFLPLIQRIMNSTVHSRIGVAPAQILFGNACNLTRGLFNTREQVERHHHNGIPLSKWADDMLAKQAQLIKIAEETQLKHDESHIAKHTHGEITKFAINSYVLIEYPNSGFRAGPPTKSLTYLKGPLRVQSVDDTGNHYTLLNLTNNKEEQVHIKRMRQFIPDDHTDPKAVAYKDQQLFEVERILRHKGTATRRSQMTFHVKWLGYDKESDKTWEKWDTVKNNAVLHVYLREHKMAKLIPPRFQLAQP